MAYALVFSLACAMTAVGAAWGFAEQSTTVAGTANQFSMSVDGADGCDTAGGSTTCTMDPSTTFTLIVSLDAINLPDNNGNSTFGYTGFQVRVDNTAGLNQLDTSGTDEVVWPDGSFFAESRSGTSVLIGGAAGSESTFLGDIVALDYTCKTSGTLTMVHDAAVGTNIIDDFGNAIADDSNGANESLAINCGDDATPTDEPTSTHTSTPPAGETPFPTPTPVATGIATATSAPTDTPSQIQTATATATTPVGAATSTMTQTPISTPATATTPVDAATSTMTQTPTSTPATSTGTGDTDCDGVTNAIDAALVLQVVAALLDVLPCPEGGDTNRDGRTDAIDAALILQFGAGLIPDLPV